MKISRHTPRHQLLEPAYISLLIENNWRMMMFKSCKEFKAKWSKHYSCARQNWNSPICSQPKNKPNQNIELLLLNTFWKTNKNYEKVVHCLSKLPEFTKQTNLSLRSESIKFRCYKIYTYLYIYVYILNLKHQETVYQKHVSAK